jgi:hypothetical protein
MSCSENRQSRHKIIFSSSVYRYPQNAGRVAIVCVTQNRPFLSHAHLSSPSCPVKVIANSYFRKWYMSKIGDCSESELKSAIKKFFQFLAEKKGIRNEKVLMSFGIR